MTTHLNDVKINLNSDHIAGIPREPYHHGDLRAALIRAGAEILDERGLAGFSLREAARRVGVSAGAPAHHFGDARGLLTAIATLAFRGLAEGLEAANAEGGADRSARLMAQGRAYVGFALANPARFDLMWRHEVLNTGDPDFRQTSAGAFSLLHELVTGSAIDICEVPEAEMTAIDPAVILAWSTVHGFAVLARHSAFDPHTPGLLEGVLSRLNI